MKDLDIIDILHDAVDAYLPSILEEDRRQKALKFLRGSEAYLATRPAHRKSAEIISLDDYAVLPRAWKAIRRTRRSALADATNYLQHSVS
ncbi:hypothetical protein J2Z31_001732 [Sinorhizobium kostiense]|uniref:Uncharacterized protein n=1 Tax=Sinorhizobium kostiense TaxID=76747 RepID=A0ABS4QX58_9HYPH|nr:hypothetical protein [Sinorhizobium kostiense]MBP2235240.1 hypothetical protein [Sinorhizobium kostiense]